jgi:hypothetical protein
MSKFFLAISWRAKASYIQWITNNYEVIYVIKTVMKYHLKKIDTSFHQPLPDMVQRLFADVINDAIWFMNIHEQNHP